jgi:hypothetical protein
MDQLYVFHSNIINPMHIQQPTKVIIFLSDIPFFGPESSTTFMSYTGQIFYIYLA